MVKCCCGAQSLGCSCHWSHSLPLGRRVFNKKDLLKILKRKIRLSSLPYISINISDYLADTWHLSPEEHGAYLLLIMNYWQTEKPIPENRVQGITRLCNERYNVVMGTLKEFFNEDENGHWFHRRIEADLMMVREKSRKASEAGKLSAQKRWGDKTVDNEGLDGLPIDDPQQKNNGRVTNKNKNKNKNIYKPPVPDGVSVELWDEYLKTRTRLKAPNSEQAITTLTNKLLKLSAQGIPPNELIAEANSNGWKSVYPPKKINDYSEPISRIPGR